MKVKRRDFNIKVEGVLFEENRATCVMGHVEPVREELVVNIINYFL